MPRLLRLSWVALVSFGWVLPAWLGYTTCLEFVRRETPVSEESLAFVKWSGRVALLWLVLAFLYSLWIAVGAIVRQRAAQHS